MNHHSLRVRTAFWPLLAALSLLAAIYLVNVPGFILFHGLAEIFAIVISCSVFTLTWNTRRFLTNDYLLFTGIALLAASVLNALHTLSYKGMGVFQPADANLPTQLWLARRYLESISLLVALWFVRRRVNPTVTLVAFGAITAVLVGAIFAGVFPAAYVEGVGLTPFKKVSEYVIAGLFLAAAFGLHRHRDHFERDVSTALFWSLIIAAVAELLFTLYAGVYDLPNRLGHFLAIVSYYLIYVAIIKTGIVRPYTLLTAANTSLSQREAALCAEVLEREQAETTLLRQTQWLRSLHEIDQALLRRHSLSEIAGATARSLVEVTGAMRAAIGLFRPEAGQLAWLGADGVDPGLPATMPLSSYWLLEENYQQRIGTVPDVQALPEGDARRGKLLKAGIRCYTGVPLVCDDETIGTIVLGHPQPGPLASDVQDFLRQVADQLAVAINQARLFDQLELGREQLRSLSHHLVNLQEAERKYLSRELHDRSGQSMTALKLHLLALKRTPGDPDVVRARIDEILEIADCVTTDLHDLAANLRPVALDRYGLAPAIEQHLDSFRRQHHVATELTATGLDCERLPADAETAIYRIVQESLTNVARHARPTRVCVAITRLDDEVTVTVRDDGQGFDVAEALARGRLGLLGMRERAEMLGGKLEVDSKPGSGTTVNVRVLAREPARAA